MSEAPTRAATASPCSNARQPFLETIESGVSQGGFRVEDDVEDLVTVLIGILDGLIVPRELRHDWFRPEPVRQTVRTTLAALLGVDDRPGRPLGNADRGRARPGSQAET